MAMEMTRASGGRADAQRYSRLINEHARSAASGDRYALDRAFQVCIFVGVRMHEWEYACMQLCVCFHASFSLSLSLAICGATTYIFRAVCKCVDDTSRPISRRAHSILHLPPAFRIRGDAQHCV